MSHAAALTLPWIAAQARQLLGQRGHAWLLQGPSGLGQYELAYALVRAWLCDQASADGACGHCASCHAIDVHAHTDLAVLMPETVMLELGWPLSEKSQAEIDKKERKPSREIRVDAMRDMLEFAQRTSGRGRGKAVLIYPAERMNPVTANALLKTLEEPPGDVRFVLASEAAHLLLPTVRSRCLGHTMAWPAAADALAWLVAQGCPSPDAAVLLRAAGGRPSDALRRAALNAERAPSAKSAAQHWHQLPQALAKGDATVLADMPPAQVIDTLQKLCHDLLAQACAAPPRFFDAADLPVMPAHRSSPDPIWTVLTDWARSLAQAARTAEHPYNPGLMVEALGSQAYRAIHLTLAGSSQPRQPRQRP
jgi:DNA polymerase-3 subunit delta'